ncbi:hypothetical protein [Algoriphagus chordae]|uniref:6-bladed beta-propeller protein n=1 Tax=Algoriphagus chordae TaxID=237019 RepID=A0A2W7R964_9BACT|nr:hypothetical protein [Algoriphagus chordae]PZX55636.1 hypothetical protein LV85_00861 [Algoriphagus chordae]
MKNFLLLLLAAIVACSEKTQETQSDAYVPDLVIADSLVIDNLTQLTFIDVKEDHSEYLFYDFKTSEFFRIGKSGEIILKANRSEDGKDSYKSSYFSTAHYLKNDRILVLTYALASIYDLDFNLIESKNVDFELITRTGGGSRAALTSGDYLYTFSLDTDGDVDTIVGSEEFSIAYPFMRIRDINIFDTLYTSFIPKETQMAVNPGLYNNLDPIVKIIKDEMYVLFPNSPEMYVYDFPALNLKTSWDLNPGDNYKQTLPQDPDINFDGFLKELAGSQYKAFTFSNGNLLTIYEGAAPQDEVDKLPKEYIGGPEFTEMAEKYKNKTYYQIFKDEKKLWEGFWDINLMSVRDILYSNAKPGEDPDAVEKDMQTYYFYELR